MSAPVWERDGALSGGTLAGEQWAHDWQQWLRAAPGTYRGFATHMALQFASPGVSREEAERIVDAVLAGLNSMSEAGQ